MPNFELRKKALKSMLSEKPPMSVKRREPGQLGHMSDEKPEDMGMISMMVTAEEKEMIEEMRAEKGESPDDIEESGTESLDFD